MVVLAGVTAYRTSGRTRRSSRVLFTRSQCSTGELAEGESYNDRFRDLVLSVTTATVIFMLSRNRVVEWLLGEGLQAVEAGVGEGPPAI